MQLLCLDNVLRLAGQRAYTNNCPSANVYKFEGKERDTETGNDDLAPATTPTASSAGSAPTGNNTPVPVPYALK